MTSPLQVTQAAGAHETAHEAAHEAGREPDVVVRARAQAARYAADLARRGLSLPGSPACGRPCRVGRASLGGSGVVVAVATTAAEVPELTGQVLAARDAGADVVELRVDTWSVAQEAGEAGGGELRDEDAARRLAQRVCETTAELVGVLEGALPVLVTVRTAAEGGALALSDAAYGVLVAGLVEGLGRGEGGQSLMWGVDVEEARGCLPRVAELAHAHGVAVVASAHDFHATPAAADLLATLARMEAGGADVAKVALMPGGGGQADADVAEVVAACVQARSLLEVPVVAISMGQAGAVTRLFGGVFGSALTFATAAGQASAPGQLPVDVVRQAAGEDTAAVCGVTA